MVFSWLEEESKKLLRNLQKGEARDLVEVRKAREHVEIIKDFYTTWVENVQSLSDEQLRKIVFNEDGFFQNNIEIFERMIRKDENGKRNINMLSNQACDKSYVLREMEQLIEYEKGVLARIKNDERQAAKREFARREKSIEPFKKEVEAFRKKWLWRGKEVRISQFESDKEKLEAEIAHGREQLERCRTMLSEEQFQRELGTVEQTYQNTEALGNQLCREYEFYIKQTEICDQYEKELIPQLEKLAAQAKAYIAMDENDTWRQKDDEIVEQANKLQVACDEIVATMKMKNMQETNTTENNNYYYFLQDMRELETRQQSVQDVSQKMIDQIQEITKMLAEKETMDRSHIPVYDPACGKEVVYLEYNREFDRTILLYNGKELSDDSALYQIENMAPQEWFTEDKNWEGLPVQLADEINDDFVLQFRGSAEEYKMVEDAFAKADLDGLVCTIEWIKK